MQPYNRGRNREALRKAIKEEEPDKKVWNKINVLEELSQEIEEAAKEEREKYLDERDLQVLSEGLSQLKEHFDNLPTEALPNILIFPETSARPLVYVVKPLITQVYKLRGVPVPSIQFINVSRDEEIFTYICEGEGVFIERQKERKKEELREEIEYMEEEVERSETFGNEGSDYHRAQRDMYATQIKERKKHIQYLLVMDHTKAELEDEIEQLKHWLSSLDEEAGRPDDEDRAYYEEIIKIYEEDLQYLVENSHDIEVFKNSLTERVQSVTNSTKARLKEIMSKDNAKPFFVDDYVLEGRTFEIIFSLLEEVAHSDGAASTYFSFFDSDPGNTSRKFQQQGEYFFGTSSEVDTLKNYSGFTYRRIPFTFNPDKFIWYKEENEQQIGVSKKSGGEYVERSIQADPEKMKALRKQLSKIGEAFVQQSVEEDTNDAA